MTYDEMPGAYESTICERFGFRPSGAVPCPLVVAGRRCRLGSHGDCLCRRFVARILDHTRIWLDAERRHVLTCEPYDPDPEMLAAFRDALAPFGVTVQVHPENYWYHGTTLLLCRGPEKPPAIHGAEKREPRC
jgi:hypothetical protein